MDNPYAPTTTVDVNSRPLDRLDVLWCCIATICVMIVIGNYWTATTTYWETNLFMNFVFLISPLVLASHLSLLRRIPGRKSIHLSILSALLVMLAFGYAWRLWFSPNQFEGFVLMNTFFGPYGWMQWMWLVFIGVLPMSYCFGRFQNQFGLRIIVSMGSIIACIHNAAYVFQSCHGIP